MAETKKYYPINSDDVYVKVFNEIISEVDHCFFDVNVINSFNNLSVLAQYLVTRLYIRKTRWVRVKELHKYLPIEELEPTLAELEKLNWVSTSPSTANLLLEIASQKELMEIAKDIGYKQTNSNRKTLAEKLVQLEKQQQSFNTKSKISTLLQIECCRLIEDKRDVLFNLEQMFLFPIGPDASLETLYLTHMKKHAFLKYKYEPQVKSPIFNSKESFMAYVDARKLCMKIEEALTLTSKKIHLVDLETQIKLENGLIQSKELNYEQAQHVYGRGMYNLSQLFMKAHRFRDEYNWIKKYLTVSSHKSKRGVSLIRKLLLEIRFLTESGLVGDNPWLHTAVNTYLDAVSEVNDIERLDLERKTSKLMSTIRSTGLQSALSVIISSSQPDLIKINFPTTEVIAKPIKLDDTKKIRLQYGDGMDVERTALAQYTEYHGAHYENSIMLTILWLLVYDLVFCDSSQFRCAYQMYPLQVQRVLNDHAGEIDQRLLSIKETVIKNRRLILQKYPGLPKPYVGGVNWNITENNIVLVLDGLGNNKTRLILKRILSNYFKFSSGFPDLTLWHNTSTHTKFVEVKSENDVLSDNQILWLRFLLNNGIDAEVCRVIPKKKRKRGVQT